jgi:predicted dienelactone hydrolase
MKSFLISVFFVFFFSISQQLAAQPYFTGHTTISFTDSTRSNRSIPTEVYYPATITGDNAPFAGTSTQTYPLVVFGHGFVMTWSAYENIWTTLTANGYIVAFPKTETGFAPVHITFAQDIAFLVSAIENEGSNASSILYQHVDSNSCVMGHSMGGGSALLSVQYNNTINAVAVLAPAETNPSAIAACSTIVLPSLILAGGNDCITQPATNQIPMYNALISSCKSIVTVTGGSHCQFAESNFNCSIGEATCTPAPAISRAFQHAVVDSVLVPWLNNYLKSNCTDGIAFQNLLSTSPNITSQQNCQICSVSNINTIPQIKTIINFDGNTLFVKSNFAINNIQLYNLQGQVFYSTVVNNELNEFTILLPELAAGIILVKVAGAVGNSVIKISTINK